jgi:hypothetical protein
MVPGGCGSKVLRQSAHEGGKVVSPTHRPPLPQEIFLAHIFLLEAESTPRLECDRKDHFNKKIPVAQSEIDPATFWFVAQCLNH